MPMPFRILHSRFSRRIFLLFLVCIIVPMGLTFFYSYHHVAKQLEAQHFRRLHQQVRTTSHSIYERLVFLRGELNLLASRLPLEEMQASEIARLVKVSLNKSAYQRFSGILFQKGGRHIQVYGNIQTWPHLTSADAGILRNGKTVLLTHDRPGSYPALFMVVPVVSNSPDSGVLYGKIATEYLWGIGSMNALPPMTDLFVLNTDTDTDTDAGTEADNRLLIASVPASGKAPNAAITLDDTKFSQCSDKIYWQYGEESHVAACRYLFLEGQFSVPGWNIVLSQSRNDIRTSLEDFKVLFPLFSLLILLVVLLTSAITIRRSLTPLQELRQATRAIAAGGFDAKAVITSGDEFEELADDFNRMNEQIQRQFSTLKLNAEIGHHMASTIDPRTLADRVLESICSHLNFDAGFLGWHVPGDQPFIGSGSYGLRPEQEEAIEQQWLSTNMDGAEKNRQEPFSETIVPDLGRIAGADKSLSQPLKFAGRTSGILMVFKNNTDPMPDNAETILSAMTDEVSVSLSNIYALSMFLESEKKFRSIFENSAAGIALLDAEGRCIKANSSLYHMLGYAEEELLNKTVADLLTDQSRPIVEGLYEELQSGSRDTGSLEESFVHKDGQPLFHIGMVQDITELKEVREKNNNLEKQLQQTQKMEAIGTLAGGIAHDFNNILMGIRGYTELALLSVETSDPLRPTLEEVLKATGRAADLVKQILAFSRQGSMEKQVIQLVPLVKEALKLLRATLPAGIRIEETYADELPPVLANPTEIHQVVMNLCTNAYHAMEENDTGILRVQVNGTQSLPDHLNHTPANPRTTHDGAWVKLSVADNGVGIAPEHLSRIFEPYYTTKPTGKGTGLGLSVALGIVRKANGYIDIQSRPEEGTTIDTYFPEHPLPHDEQEPRNTTNFTGSERIMLIDDEESIAAVEKNLLEKSGYRVTAFNRPEEALDAFRGHPHAFDLVITDKNMPGMNGHELAQSLMALRPDIPVLMASGFHGSQLAEESTTPSGRIDYIPKPLGHAELTKAIRKMLDASSPPRGETRDPRVNNLNSREL
ncbi:MAG: response regulator [Thermodesulfobacteriota bacterium]|nr:response regulator [Thermodesulfobacteriota bacterium]